MLHSWLSRLPAQTLFARPEKHASRPSAASRFRQRPGVEILEVRAVPSGVSFFDDTFNDADWTGLNIAYNASAAGSIFTTGQVLSGGDPGAFQGMTKSWKGPGGILVGELKNGAIFDPSKQGPIASIDFSLDAETIADPGGLGVDFFSAISPKR